MLLFGERGEWKTDAQLCNQSFIRLYFLHFLSPYKINSPIVMSKVTRKNNSTVLLCAIIWCVVISLIFLLKLLPVIIALNYWSISFALFSIVNTNKHSAIGLQARELQDAFEKRNSISTFGLFRQNKRKEIKY